MIVPFIMLHVLVDANGYLTCTLRKPWRRCLSYRAEGLKPSSLMLTLFEGSHKPLGTSEAESTTTITTHILIRQQRQHGCAQGEIESHSLSSLCKLADTIQYVEELQKKKQSDVLRFLLRVRCWEVRHSADLRTLHNPLALQSLRRLSRGMHIVAPLVSCYTLVELS